MRILLDTNIWRYLVDAGLGDKLFQVSRKSNLKIVIAPAIVIETLRMSDITTKRKIIELQTRGSWDRLMPDAFLECEDVKREMIRVHPEWELKSKNISLFRKLRYDWIREKGGFWEKVRMDPQKIAEQYKRQDSSDLEKVRNLSREMRQSVSERGTPMINTTSIKDWKGSWRNLLTGKEVVADAWRVYSELIWGNMLTRESAFRQWLGCEIDIDFLLSYGASEFVRFWQSEAIAENVPRAWVRAVIYGMQSERKVTDGNPTDSAISIHALDVDLIVSADKNFIAMLNWLQDGAPFKTAHGILVGAGNAGVEELLHILSNTVLLMEGSATRH
jgi:hypothetical protein